jgi:hypothetical protein
MQNQASCTLCHPLQRHNQALKVVIIVSAAFPFSAVVAKLLALLAQVLRVGLVFVYALQIFFALLEWLLCSSSSGSSNSRIDGSVSSSRSTAKQEGGNAGRWEKLVL